METKANYVLIGLFTLAIVAAVFGFVYWFQNIGGTGERATYRVIFDSPVVGLRTGASVLFNGIRVGVVTDLQLSPDRPQRVIATASIDKSVSVRADTSVGLDYQGLTGIASLSLRGGSAAAPILTGSKNEPPTLIAESGATQDITQATRDVLRRFDSFLVENQEVFHSALKNIDTFSAALARNSERIDHIAAGLEELTGGADGKSGEINQAVRSIRELAEHLDKRTAEITEGINRFTAKGSKEFELLSRNARNTLSNIDRTVRNIDKNPSRLLFGGGSSGQNQ